MGGIRGLARGGTRAPEASWQALSKLLSACVPGVSVYPATAESCARQTTTTVQPTSAAMELSVWMQSMATHASAPRASGMAEEVGAGTGMRLTMATPWRVSEST